MTDDTKPTGQPDLSLDRKAADAPVDTGPVDTGPVDTGPVDTRPVDPKTGKPLAPAKPAVKLTQAPGEQEGPQGPEPTRYGDWERKGIVSDF